MDTPPPPLLTDLPASAQRVLAGHLSGSAAGACRLASPLLSGVTADSGARLWVVVNTFRAQLARDASNAGRATAGSAYDDSLLAATSLARAAEGASSALVLVDASRPCESDVWDLLFRSLLSSSSLRELTVTEFFSHASTHLQRGLSNREISAGSDFAWSMAEQQQQQQQQDAHSSSSSSSSGGGCGSSNGRQVSSTLAAYDCAWLPALVAAANGRAQRTDNQQQQQQQQHAAPASSLGLTLQLLAPLPPSCAMQLVQLQSLSSLAVVWTPAFLRKRTQPPPSRSQRSPHSVGGRGGAYADFASGAAPPSELDTCPVLSVATLQQLSRLPNLSSLTAIVGPPLVSTQTAGQVGTMLQQLLVDLGPQLTQLNLGTSPIHLRNGVFNTFFVAAPWRMPALASLTCDHGFAFDLDDEWDATDSAAAAVAAVAAAQGAGSSSGDGGSTSTSMALLPSLTRLELIDAMCVPEALERVVASEAACRQLQHLQIPDLMFDDAPDFNAFENVFAFGGGDAAAAAAPARRDPAANTLQQLCRLRGLQQLQAVVCGQQQLDALVAGVGTQLLGLTVVCQEGDAQYLPPVSYLAGTVRNLVSLQPLFDLSRLTSLKIVGSNGAVLDPQRDLPAMCQGLTALKSLSYTGRIHALPQRGFELLPGMLPASLQGLTLVCRQSGGATPVGAVDSDGKYVAHPGSLPQGLTSLKCRGFWWQRPGGEVAPWSPWFGWELLPAGLRQLELDAEAALSTAGPGSILPVSSPLAPQQQCDPLLGPTGLEALSVCDSSTAAAVHAVAAEARMRPCEAQPRLVALPALQSLAVHLSANRHAEEEDADAAHALSLAGLLCHLSGLTSLTQLHISSSSLTAKLGEELPGLCSLRQLKVLTLDVGLDGTLLEEATLALQVLLSALVSALVAGSVSGLRVLRLPLLSACVTRDSLAFVEEQLPNCLVVEADDVPLGVVGVGAAAAAALI